MQTELLGPLVAGLIQLFKGQFKFMRNHAPLVALALGVGMAGLVYGSWGTEVIINGISVGLSAVGLFSASKHYLGEKES